MRMEILRRPLMTVLLAAGLSAMAGAATADDLELETLSPEALAAEARAAVETWVGALVGNDPERVAPVLAPEFQIQRGDGSAYDRDGYLAAGLPGFTAMPEIVDIVATGHDDVLVVRYTLTVPADSTLDDQTVAPLAPRLTVFRHEDGVWLVSAHANFRAPAK